MVGVGVFEGVNDRVSVGVGVWLGVWVGGELAVWVGDAVIDGRLVTVCEEVGVRTGAVSTNFVGVLVTATDA
jgi:hypothetical protein